MGLRITNIDGDKPALWIYGSIGADYPGGVIADDVRDALAQIPQSKNFDVRIFSDGGSFDEAMAIFSLLSPRQEKTHGIVDGIAASAGSLLLQATGTRSMAEHSRQMIHEVHGFINKSMRADEFREMADQMDATNKDLVAIYSKRWKGTERELMSALAKDTYYRAEETIPVGLADRVIKGLGVTARVNSDIFKYSNMPEGVIRGSGPITLPWHEQFEKKLTASLSKEKVIT